MLSVELEQTLNDAVKTARARHFEYITVEHLLLALLEDQSASTVLKAVGCNEKKLRTALEEFIDTTLPVLPPESEDETQPTLGFQRVITADFACTGFREKGSKWCKCAGCYLL